MDYMIIYSGQQPNNNISMEPIFFCCLDMIYAEKEVQGAEAILDMLNDHIMHNW